VRLDMLIERVADRVGRIGARQVEMSGLGQGMDARIGAAGAMHPDRLAAEAERRLFDDLLHREPVFWRCQPTRPVPSYSSVSL